MRRLLLIAAFSLGAWAQSGLTPGVKPFIAVDAPVIALEHVRILDGTGAAPIEDQTIVIEAGRVKAIGPASQIQAPAGAHRMELREHTVIPGLVGMHEHLFIRQWEARCRSTSSTG